MKSWAITGLVVARDEDKSKKIEQIDGLLKVSVKAENLPAAITESEAFLDKDNLISVFEEEAEAA